MTTTEKPVVSAEELQAEAWKGFTGGNWEKNIDVRDFIQ